MEAGKVQDLPQTRGESLSNSLNKYQNSLLCLQSSYRILDSPSFYNCESVPQNKYPSRHVQMHISYLFYFSDIERRHKKIDYLQKELLPTQSSIPSKRFQPHPPQKQILEAGPRRLFQRAGAYAFNTKTLALFPSVTCIWKNQYK